MLMAGGTVAELTVEELKNLIREVVLQTLSEMLGDPDEGLSVKEEFQWEIQKSLAAVEAGGTRKPIQQLAEDLGLTW